jgi:hypothetical protein
VHNDRMSATTGRLAAALLVVGTLAGGCSDDSPDPDVQDDSSTSSSPSPSVTEPVAGDASYLPVPEGVELTPQGSELKVGDPAVVAWEPRQDLVGVIDVTVTRLERTTFAESFQGWQLDQKDRTSTPYFVHATVANVGQTDVGGRDVPLYAVDPTDALIQANNFQIRFDPCPGNRVFPKTFGPGEEANLCLVYLVPDGGELTAVSFRPIQEFDPITWTGPISKPDQPKQN